jgi:hypothetical protein
MAGQVGRISGGVLADNLLRNGIDLNFKNTSTDTALLQLKVASNRIGIKTESPSADLEVVDTIGAVGLEQDNYANIGPFTIQDSEINVAPGNLYLNAASNILATGIETDDVKINNKVISTITADANLELRPYGTKTVEIHANTNVTGSLNATGNITFGGNLTLGNDDADSVNFAADVKSDIVPDQNSVYNLGSPTKKWQNLYSNLLNGQRVEVDALTVSDTSLARRQGNIFYVSTLGNDTNVGDHQHGAFRTIEHALAVADASTAGPVTIYIFPGEYDELCPLVVPENTTITGDDIRNTIIRPNTSSQGEDIFQLNQNTLVENITITDFYYNAVDNTGYAFRFAANAILVDRSPYVKNITVITSNDGGVAGHGAWIDGSEVNSASTHASMLFHNATFITPEVDCITMTNGVRVEWLNSFTYFANRGLYATQGTAGFGSSVVGFDSILGFYGQNGIVLTGDGSKTVTVDVSLTGVITIVSIDVGAVSGYYISTGGTTWVVTLGKFGAEIRSIGSANVYGTYGAVADGVDTLMYLISHNFAYIGSVTDVTNDRTLTLQDQETVELNSGRIYYTATDADGTFRVGDAFYVNFEDGSTSIDASSVDFSGISSIFINTGGSITYIDGARIDIGNIRFSGNTITTVVGDLIWSSASGFIDTSNNPGFILPQGTTIQRISEQSDIRYNTETNLFEGFSSANVAFGGIYSDNRNTQVTAPTNNNIVFTANGIEAARVLPGKIVVNDLTNSDVYFTSNTISTTVGNNNLELLPNNNGVVTIYDIILNSNVIENTAATNLQIAHTGQGYLKFDTTLGIVVPTGSDVDRPLTPEIGDTRWNVERDYLEIYTASGWQRAAGSGEIVTEATMNELLDLYTLVFG